MGLLKNFWDWVWLRFFGIEACVLGFEVWEFVLMGRNSVAHAFRFVRVKGLRFCIFWDVTTQCI